MTSGVSSNLVSDMLQLVEANNNDFWSELKPV